MKNKLILLFLFVIQISFAQEKIIHVRISAGGNSVEGINVVNLVNEKSAVSDYNGEFFILAKAEDLLVFSAINFEYKRKIIDESDLNLKIIEIEMVPKTNQIDEVVIEKYNINAVELGILSKPAKVYTPAERKVRTATTGLLDPLLNLISGRTKDLKSNVEVERKIFNLEKLEDLYEDEYFVKTLKIPAENVSGFKYFAVENNELAQAIKAKNKTLTDFLLVQISEKYKAQQLEEKQ